MGSDIQAAEGMCSPVATYSGVYLLQFHRMIILQGECAFAGQVRVPLKLSLFHFQ